MSTTLALIPAKRISAEVPNKNWKPISGRFCCTELALIVGIQSCDRAVLSTDHDVTRLSPAAFGLPDTVTIHRRPDELCQPTTPMLDVVKHALESIPGPDDEIVALLQPTSPLRTAETVKKAIRMLEDNDRADSVVSVSLGYPWQWSLVVDSGFVYPVHDRGDVEGVWEWTPKRRQDCEPTYKRDGTVYAFRRSLAMQYDTIYGRALPLFTPPEESLSIDTPADWDEAVRRLAARNARGPASSSTDRPT